MRPAVRRPTVRCPIVSHPIVRRMIALLLAAAAFLVSAPRGFCQQKEELPHPKTLEELQKAMKGALDKEHVTGAGVALVQGGQVLWCGGFGKADIAANREINCDTEFRVGSISKSFVALALLKLQEEGKIDLNARLEDVAPEIQVTNSWNTTNPVRIVNLLEHTAGFDDMTFSEVYNRKDSADYPLLKVFQDHPGPQTVRWPPSTRFSYSNPGFGIAGYVIEKISKQPYDVYIHDNFLAPLGIAAGDFRLTEKNKALLAQGYEGNPAKAVPYKNIYLRPAGDMKASPGELAKLVQFFLRRGKAGETPLVKPESIARMEYPETSLSSRNGLRLGYGLANYTEVAGNVVTHGHDGGIDGFISTYRYMPEQNWGYVVLLNSTVSGKALEDLNKLAIDFLSKDFSKPQQATVSLSPAELAKFAGYYAPRAPRNQLFSFMDDLTGLIKISVQGDKLMRGGLFGKPEALIAVGPNLFRGEQEAQATSVFFADSSGKMIYVDSGLEGVAYAEKTSPVWPYTRIALLVLSFVLFATSLLFAVVWVLRWLFGGLKGVRHISVRAVPLLAILCLMVCIFGFSRVLSDTGEATPWAIALYLATFGFAIFSLIGLWLVIRVPRAEIHRGVWIHSLLVSLACGTVAAFLASWHLIGLRVWAP